MIPSFKTYFYSVYSEAKVLPFTSKNRNVYVYPDEYPPLKDSDTIRVYHAFHDQIDVIRTLKYGLSGQERANRRYSYEANNNPKGIFVTIAFDVAKEFGDYVIEFHTKVSDLEAPVWPGGGYTVQGQMAQYFDGDEDREKARLNRREEAKKSKYDSIKNSDRPELAELLYSGGEAQALFIGQLNPNSVRAIWINPTPEKSGKYSTYKKLTRNEFLQKFGDKDKVIRNDYRGRTEIPDNTPLQNRVLKPRDKFEVNNFFNKIIEKHSTKRNKLTAEELTDIFKNMDDQQWLSYVWPNQLTDAKNAIKNL